MIACVRQIVQLADRAEVKDTLFAPTIVL